MIISFGMNLGSVWPLGVWGVGKCGVHLLALLFFIITIALRNIRISSSLCKAKEQIMNCGEVSESPHRGRTDDHHIERRAPARSPSRSRRSCRPPAGSPGARTHRAPFGAAGRRRSWRSTWCSRASAAICRSEVSGTRRHRRLWSDPCRRQRPTDEHRRVRGEVTAGGLNVPTGLNCACVK